jgi:glycosyltransferase involved in cell wall biosynthesis
MSEAVSISVIMPVHNNHRYLRAALETIRFQDVAGCEVIVVDDGSDPPVAGLVKEVLPDAKVLRQPNGGPSAARNAGLRLAAGNFVAFLDADDLWTANALGVLMKGFRDAPDADVVQGHVKRFAETASFSSSKDAPLGNPSLGFNVGALMVRRQIMSAIGLFDESLRQSEDVDLFMRLHEHGAKRIIIPDTVLEYRRHESSVTAISPPDVIGQGAAESWLRLLHRYGARRRLGQASGSSLKLPVWSPPAPPVSVVLTVQDGRKYLPAALLSIRRQTLVPAEIVAIVGPSTDGTHDYLQAQGDVRVIAQERSGLAQARNQAMGEVRGPLIAFLDHDDIWHNRKLEMQVRAIELFKGPAASITNFRLVQDADPADPSIVTPVANQGPRLGWTPSALLAHCDVFQSIGGFDPALGMGCDTDWFRGFRRSGLGCGVASQVLVHKRIHAGNLSREAARNRAAMFQMLRKHRAELRNDGPVLGALRD